MYCIRCGVKLAETERKCPLCNTVVCHPDFQQAPQKLLYPENKMPAPPAGFKSLSGAIIIIFLVPLLVSLFSDLQRNGRLDWFGFVAGGLGVMYVMFALPLWFRKPNPVIFVPCSFAAAGLYLWYIDFATGGNWFWTFGLPLVGALCLVVSAVVTLTRYLKRGKLYIYGGACMAMGVYVGLTEYLLSLTFGVQLIGWSVYPMVVLILLGGLLIYLAIDPVARETLERKLFF